MTYTLKYNKMHWLTIDALNRHWDEARVVIKPVGDELQIIATNVAAMTVKPPEGHPRKVRINGEESLEIPANGSFVHDGASWKAGQPQGLRKKSGLQGPIDDGLMDSFIFVKPSKACRSETVEKWVNAEFEHAVTHWRRQMRGDAVVKLDTEITEKDLAESNLVLWGDSQANQVLARIADKLPIKWTAEQVIVGEDKYDAAHHAPILIYPNPLNPEKYVVLNSGFTYREYDYLNNARQVPKLPDWAIIDLRVAPNARHPGKVANADFFNEKWELKAR